MASIRTKIRLGFVSLAAVVVAFALLAYADLRWVEHRIAEGTAVAEFRERTLEMRRHEKNLFLYRDPADLDAALQSAADATRTLRAEAGTFESTLPAVDLDALKQLLHHYVELVGAHRSPAATQDLQPQIRAAGHQISAMADAIADSERLLLARATQQSGLVLLLSVVVVIVLAGLLGRLLSRSVARPLEELEKALQPIGEGRFAALAVRFTDREIASFVRAFNAMLDELKARQQQLRRSEKLASLGTLLAGVAHELNNPLSNISTSCQLLKEEIDGRAGELERELIEQIDEQSLRARDIVRSLLDFSREHKLVAEPVALRPLIEETIRFLRGQKAPGAEIRLDVPEPLQVAGNRQRLQQALLNLLKNALQAVGDQGVVTVRARAWQKGDPAPPLTSPAIDYRGVCDAASAIVDIEVHDDGPGIPADVLPRVFDPFFTTKDVGQGSGLGLAVVHDIVEEHGGCIAARSAPGAGTSFFIRLPCRRAVAAEAAAREEGSAHG